MNINAAIERYSQIVASAQRGVTTPALQREAQNIRNRARAILSPQEQQRALQASQAIVTEMHRRADLSQAQEQLRNQQYQMDKVARETIGMDAAQMQAALATGKVPVKGTRHATRDQVESNLKGHLKGLGKADMTLDQFQKTVDAYEVKVATRGKEFASAYIHRKFGEHGAQAENLVNGWSDSGISEKLALAGEQPKDFEREVTDSTMRRTQIFDAFAQEATKDKAAARELVAGDDIIPEYMESDEIHGDISRAFAAHEEAAEAEEYESYSPDTFDVTSDTEEQEHAPI